MQAAFNALIDSYLANKIGVSDTFLPENLAVLLKQNLLHIFAANEFKAAEIGNNSSKTENKTIRNDVIYWLDKKHNDIHENSFFELIDAFVYFLNSTCYTSITSYEFHYALYEKGSFYKRHLDQFKTSNSRAFSMIFYLNENWESAHGGELCVYDGENTIIISPENKKCVFFKSNELEHEVLLSHKQRMSITGWLRTD